MRWEEDRKRNEVKRQGGRRRKRIDRKGEK